VVYRIPPDFDGRAFVGQVLSSITFTENTVHLVFGSELSLTVLAAYLYQLSTDGTTRNERVPAAETAALGLVGRRVLNTAHHSQSFTLELDSGGTFTCIDDSDQYESFIIKIEDGEMIV
jgi:hypothetical protein